MTAKICDFCNKQINEGPICNVMPKVYEIAWGYDGTFINRHKVKMDICPVCWKDMRDYVMVIQGKRLPKGEGEE